MLDPEWQQYYDDIIQLRLSQPGREVLETMQASKYEYKSDLARCFIAEGEAHGRAALILKLMRARFGPLPESVQQHINKASIEELDAIGERLLEAKTLQEALHGR